VQIHDYAHTVIEYTFNINTIAIDLQQFTISSMCLSPLAPPEFCVETGTCKAVPTRAGRHGVSGTWRMPATITRPCRLTVSGPLQTRSAATSARNNARLPSLTRQTNFHEGNTMSTTAAACQFGRRLQPRERFARFPRLALRQRLNEHPMVMFSVIVAIAFLSMALIPTSGPAWAFGASPRLSAEADTTAKTGLLPTREAERACQGQAWGAENADCLDVIAKESRPGKPRKIRMLASAEPLSHTPNIF
jgi:hypothetical protein